MGDDKQPGQQTLRTTNARMMNCGYSHDNKQPCQWTAGRTNAREDECWGQQMPGMMTSGRDNEHDHEHRGQWTPQMTHTRTMTSRNSEPHPRYKCETVAIFFHFNFHSPTTMAASNCLQHVNVISFIYYIIELSYTRKNETKTSVLDHNQTD
jgi:hypothetical protein